MEDTGYTPLITDAWLKMQKDCSHTPLDWYLSEEGSEAIKTAQIQIPCGNTLLLMLQKLNEFIRPEVTTFRFPSLSIQISGAVEMVAFEASGNWGQEMHIRACRAVLALWEQSFNRTPLPKRNEELQ